jgi:colanic acid biosynthesis glycosyl transferase WcaI
MRVLFISQIYRPEMGAQANRLYPLVRQLAAAGHEVSVATAMPNYPEGVVFPRYRGRLTMRERTEDCTIFRTACFTSPRNRAALPQLASYASFVPAAFLGGLRAGPVDVVMVTLPPLFPAMAAMSLASLWGARLVCDLRDLWPDEVIACGAAREGSVPVKLLRSLERQIYRRADCITTTTQSFVETITGRGAPAERVMLLPNGADLDLFRPLPPENPIAARLGLGDRFVVAYSGALGIKHGLDVVLDAARLLRDRRDIVFALIGNGARRRELTERARELGLANVLFAGEHPVEDVPHILARADVCVCPLRPDPYLAKALSVKVFEYLACEKPVVAACGGVSASVVEESGGGVAVPPGDAAALAEAILALRGDPEARLRMGREGRRYVEAHYSRTAWADRLERRLRALCPAEGVRSPLAARPRRA